MTEERLRIFILDNYARRIRLWLITLGIVLSVIGVFVVYDNLGFWEPLRYRFDAERLRWWTIALFSLSTGSVAASFVIGFTLNWGIRVVVTNPRRVVSDDARSEIRDAVANALASKMISLESALWITAGFPAIFGSVLFAIGRSPRTMLLYLAVSLITGTFFIPSLHRTEKFFEKRLNETFDEFKEIN